MSNIDIVGQKLSENQNYLILKFDNMCDLTKSFKLCTCNADELEDENVGWALQRRNLSLEQKILIGSIARIFETDKQRSTTQTVLQMLNDKNCFDFDYQPTEDDRLIIRNGQAGYTYRFVDSQWTIDNSTQFDGWRTQLEQFRLGKIDQ